MFIYKAGVIGAGSMGARIAHVISFSGLPVVLIDRNAEAVEKGMDIIKKIYYSRVEKGKMTENEASQKLNLVIPATSYDALSDADIVIEAVYENMDVKKELFKKLDGILPEASILATNTSALSISEIGSATKRPDRVIGLHFFNPPHVMKLVEIIPSLSTSQSVVDDVVSFAEGLRKIPVKVNECAGFLVNRLLMPYMNEALFAFQEGAGTLREIDAKMVEFGMPMGPFTLADMIGIDISAEVAKILEDSFGLRMSPAQTFQTLIKEGRLGQKSGCGFYPYTEDKQDFKLPAIIGKRTSFSVERLLLPMINEAAICLQEGVATARDIDIAMIAGTGFPEHTGGPLHYADTAGLDNILDLMIKHMEIGERFRPAPIIKRMVSSGFLGKKTGRGFFGY